MACVANAGEGGETTFIDADDLVACLEQEAPDLLDELESRTMPHARSGDRREEKVIERSGDSTLVSWTYYCVDPNVDAEGRALADRFFNYLRASPLRSEEHTSELQSLMRNPYAVYCLHKKKIISY